MGLDGITSKYPPEYLKSIEFIMAKRMDGNGGKKDGKVTVNEALNDLNISSLFSGLRKGSFEYINLWSLTSNMTKVLKRYAGSDGIFQPKEWAAFLNGNEWGAVLEQYHSSSNFAQMEMRRIDNSNGVITDGKLTKGDVKTSILNKILKIDRNFDTTQIEDLIDVYAGKDGTFTLSEYTALKNNPVYKAVLKKYHLLSYG